MDFDKNYLLFVMSLIKMKQSFFEVDAKSLPKLFYSHSSPKI